MKNYLKIAETLKRVYIRTYGKKAFEEMNLRVMKKLFSEYKFD